nr:unnamed protein product [Callosobruchus analis]
MDATMTTILLCFKQTYKEINHRIDSMNLERGLNDSDFARRMSTLELHYRSLKSAVDSFNNFFGLTIFLELASIIVLSLAWLTQVALTDIPPSAHTCAVPPKIISSIVVILCCDSVLEEAEKSVYICLALSERFAWKFQKRMTVYSLIQTCKDYAPEFSVLGLFHIKRNTILSLFNIISTFMIVLVQSAKNN